ncbi:MetS family NSS transporter small subunit [Clostridium perfringens]|nr:MetS family NSS transporter small subunit [Clostridium perfringens]EJT6171520.1 MetS family NSS transporter small subunit [Clostridium perfringens]EJT6542245.1 MetS family NSS transporter small subunit [Clostridium perfringens]EJT6567253.1 MetS family NSS transporter small subunit [Clostridium perfringens]MBI6021555.1 MetS family NSS transporter small subunit [Clostridium perfringens]MBS5995225.1 MetS family NSS transporter small subunit [Clostridium perfringens]
MNTTAIVFFLIGATVLWGGLALTLSMLLRNERKSI